MPQTIVITGASSGIGAALARLYAGAGVRLALMGRDPARLETVAAACRDAGADVSVAAIDVTDRAAMAAYLTAFDRDHPIDLLFANAGILSGLGSGPIEDVGASNRIVEINVLGMLNTVHPVLPLMLARQRGHIVLVGSIAGLAPLPKLPTYSASKAALLSYGLALRANLRGQGIAVSVVCPGYVATPMTAQIKGTKPFIMTPAQAAEKIRNGVARNRPVIEFPWFFALALRITALLPDRVRGLALSLGRFRVAPGD